MRLAVCFTNFGPYHLARLRALAKRLGASGGRLTAYEVASQEQTYPWRRTRGDEPFDWITLFPGRTLESLSAPECAHALEQALDRDRPDVLGVVGYARPESMASARWGRKRGLPVVLMSESQAVDRPRVWWKEAVKRRRLRLFDSALVGGPSHREYLEQLGMPGDRISLGYNAVDNAAFAASARAWRGCDQGRDGLPRSPYFLSVCRFAPEKNLPRLIEAFARYRASARAGSAWDLVLCGDGPAAALVERAIAQHGVSEWVHRPGFVQVDGLPRWYAGAGGFVLASLSEPWGLVANEAAASGLPLLISNRAGCAATLVIEPAGATGACFDPLDVDELTHRLAWLAGLGAHDRAAMGLRAAEVVASWGPDRFAAGMIEAIDRALLVRQAPRLRLRKRRVGRPRSQPEVKP